MSLPHASAPKSINYGEMGGSIDYRKVLALRFKAYASVGKIAAGYTARDMADEFDERSRILTASYQGEIVGSVRLIYHNRGDELSFGRYFRRMPAELPPRSEYLEASWMCIDPAFRGGEIFQELVDRMVALTSASGRRYIVSGASGKWIDYWQKHGFERLGVNYFSDEFGGVEHELIILDTRRPQ